MSKPYNMALHALALTHTELRQFLFLASYYCSMCTVYLPLPQANILQGIIKVSSWRKISGEVGRRISARRANPGESGGEFQTKNMHREREREHKSRETALQMQRCVAATGPCCHWQEVKGTYLSHTSLSCWPCRGGKVCECLSGCICATRTEKGSRSLSESGMNGAPSGSVSAERTHAELVAKVWTLEVCTCVFLTGHKRRCNLVNFYHVAVLGKKNGLAQFY